MHQPRRRYADIEELLELGVLQEANRRFFHVLGLELVMEIDGDGDAALRIVDCREESGGTIFAHNPSRWSRVRRTRARIVKELWDKAVATRRVRYGFEQQPTDDL